MSPQTSHDPNQEFFLQAIRNLLAPIGSFLDDPTVSEVCINGYNEIYVERRGRLERVTNAFPDASALDAAALNIAQYVRRPLDNEHPILDARLPDGSRVAIVIPPVSRKGTVVSIRRFSKEPMSPARLVELGTLSAEAIELLRAAVYAKRNILIAGGTGSGKTSLLNSLATMIPPEERILVIEDSAELQLVQPHCLNMEAQTGDEQGRGRITISDLFKSALRLRPDRIIIGEVRSDEALDMVQAMTSGHAGSIATTHAENSGDTLRRIETLALYRGLQLPQYAIRAQVASAIHLVVIIARLRDGKRRVLEISEVRGLTATGDYALAPIYFWQFLGGDEKTGFKGELRPTGEKPWFLAQGGHGTAPAAPPAAPAAPAQAAPIDREKTQVLHKDSAH